MDVNVETYALNIEQTANLIKSVPSRTVLVQGHMGTGKSSLLQVLASEHPEHTPIYFDCTTRDLGDLMLPNVGSDAECMSFLPNEELGLHLDGPVIVMLDEYGKANRSVALALLRLMLERKMGSYTLHPDSIVFATTNLGSEGVGDILPPHARNRMSVVTMRKPTKDEWILWAVGAGVDPIIMGWVNENPQVFQSFLEVRDPDDNPYIFHPQSSASAFVTPRSLETASRFVEKRAEMDDTSLTTALIGSIGLRGALDLQVFIKLANDLPKMADIKNDPENALVPENPAAVCLVVMKVLQTVEPEWASAWVKYMDRLPAEARGMFARLVGKDNFNAERRNVMMQNQDYGNWVMQNMHLFTSDKK